MYKLRSKITNLSRPHYILAIERLSSPLPVENSSGQLAPAGVPSEIEHSIGKLKSDVDHKKLRQAIFDSSGNIGYIISADGQYYLANKKARKAIGNALGGRHGAHGESVRKELKIWDGTFSRRLDPTELPGVKVVRDRKPFTNFRCGFEHHQTNEKIVMTVNGECLYDDDTGEFIGGVCWCYDLQNYYDYVSTEQKRLIASHETICNRMPHLVWTTTPDGLCDYYSDGWCTVSNTNGCFQRKPVTTTKWHGPTF